MDHERCVPDQSRFTLLLQHVVIARHKFWVFEFQSKLRLKQLPSISFPIVFRRSLIARSNRLKLQKGPEQGNRGNAGGEDLCSVSKYFRESLCATISALGFVIRIP